MAPRSLLALVLNFFSGYLFCLFHTYKGFLLLYQCSAMHVKKKKSSEFLSNIFRYSIWEYFGGYLICYIAQNTDPMDTIKLALLSSVATWPLNFQVPLLKWRTIRGVWVNAYKLIILSESTTQNL